MKISKIIFTILIFLFSSILMLFAIKGRVDKLDNLYYQQQKDTSVSGPFESSNSNARYALTEAIIKDKSFLLSPDLAKFASPDVVQYKGKFISIFTPGISLIGVPFYLLGEKIGIPQLTTYLSVTIFGILNIFLVARLARKLGAGFYESLIGGLLFLFASNSLAYSLSFTQHELSSTVLLLALINAIGKRNLIKNIIFGILVGIGILADIPNVILMAPIGIYILYKNLKFKTAQTKIKKTLAILSLLGIVLGLIPFAGIFAYYNFKTTGSYTKIAQNIGRSNAFSVDSIQNSDDYLKKGEDVGGKSSSSLPFNSRKELSGFYTLLVSDERSWLYYSPIILVGILGIWVGFKNKKTKDILVIAVAVIGTNILLYSMFGDPWGGWAFGPRYLIPAAGVLSAMIPLAITKYKKKILFMVPLALIVGYSVYINTLGALTTSAIPPKVEAKSLSTGIPYTYQYNVNLANQNQSSSLVYNAIFPKNVSLNTYIQEFSIFSFALIAITYIFSIFSKERQKQK